MALTLSAAKETRSTGLQVGGTIDRQTGQKRVTMSVSQSYRVEATGITSPDEVTDVQASRAVGIPLVNRTAWYSSTLGLTLATCVCTSKSVTRNESNGFWFDIDCEFSTGEMDGEEVAYAPPAAVTDIAPQVQSQIGSYDRVMYADKNGVQCWQMPFTKTPFSAPVVETIPVFNLTVTQFEFGLTFQQQLDRSFKLNSATYRGKDAGLWRIGAVAASEVDVQLSGGLTTVAKVVYPITLSERFYYPPGLAPTPANAVVYGWDAVQPLVDTMRMTPGPLVALVPMADPESGQPRTGYLDSTDGQERVPAGVNDDRPDYLRYRTQDVIDFSTFLQA